MTVIVEWAVVRGVHEEGAEPLKGNASVGWKREGQAPWIWRSLGPRKDHVLVKLGRSVETVVLRVTIYVRPFYLKETVDLGNWNGISSGEELTWRALDFFVPIFWHAI
jgi:hypothetical protein